MGDGSEAALPNEQPVHNVTLDTFWMAKTELTLKQWNAFIAATGYPRGRSQAQSEDHPVVSITRADPARGGLQGQQYPNGDSISLQEANYASDPPNGYGLYDMAGNVFEWVGDWYEKDYYRTSPSTNPHGPATQDNAPQRRADRGGDWCMSSEKLRVSARHAGPGPWDEGGTADCLGFRPVMEMGKN
jgi:formylglycine-generating enzyme required for sulfatase activity